MWRIAMRIAALILGVSVGIGGLNAAAQPIPEPSIAYFYVTPPNPVYGESITFNWSLENTTHLAINSITLDAPNPVGAYTVNSRDLFAQPGTYTLNITATNTQGGVDRSTTDFRTITLLSEGPTVTINSFSVTPSEVELDDTVTVTWDVSNAESLHFYGQSLPNLPTGSASFQVMDLVTVPGTYEVDLLAMSQSMMDSDLAYTTITITDSSANSPSILPLPSEALEDDPQPPQIVTFYVTPNQASMDDTVTVTWETRHAAELRLNNRVLSAASGSQQFRVADLVPGDGDHYLYLTAVAEEAGFNNVRWQSPLTVRSPRTVQTPTINAFTITPAEANAGEIVRLEWDISDADEVRINGLLIENAQFPQGALSVVVDALIDEPGEGVVTLTARDSSSDTQSEAEAPLTLAQPRPTPQILSFTVSQQTANRGDTVRLRWQVFNADQLRLDAFSSNGTQVYSRVLQNADLPIGAVELPVADVAGSAGTVTLNLWALTDTDGWDNNVRALPLFIVEENPPDEDYTQRISNQAPQVEAFTLTPQRVTLTDIVTVTWAVRGAESIYLDDVLLSRDANGRLNMMVDELTDEPGVHWLHLTARGSSIRGGQTEHDAWVALIVEDSAGDDED